MVSPVMTCGHCMEGLPSTGSLSLGPKQVSNKAQCTLRVNLIIHESQAHIGACIIMNSTDSWHCITQLACVRREQLVERGRAMYNWHVVLRGSMSLSGLLRMHASLTQSAVGLACRQPAGS